MRLRFNLCSILPEVFIAGIFAVSIFRVLSFPVFFKSDIFAVFGFQCAVFCCFQLRQFAPAPPLQHPLNRFPFGSFLVAGLHLFLIY